MPNFDDWNTFHPNNPCYQPDSEKEKDKCQCCDDEEAITLWLTTLGKKLMCKTCLEFHLEEDTHFLIEKIW